MKSGERRSAAGGEPIIESRQGRGVGGGKAGKRAQDLHGGDQRYVRRAHLPLGKRTDQAEVVAAGGIAMKRLMEGAADRNYSANEEEKRQQPT